MHLSTVKNRKELFNNDIDDLRKTILSYRRITQNMIPADELTGLYHKYLHNIKTKARFSIDAIKSFGCNWIEKINNIIKIFFNMWRFKAQWIGNCLLQVFFIFVLVISLGFLSIGNLGSIVNKTVKSAWYFFGGFLRVFKIEDFFNR